MEGKNQQEVIRLVIEQHNLFWLSPSLYFRFIVMYLFLGYRACWRDILSAGSMHQHRIVIDLSKKEQNFSNIAHVGYMHFTHAFLVSILSHSLIFHVKNVIFSDILYFCWYTRQCAFIFNLPPYLQNWRNLLTAWDDERKVTIVRDFLAIFVVACALLLVQGCSSDDGQDVEKYNRPWAQPVKWERERTLTPNDINEAFGNSKGEKKFRRNR